MKRFTGALNELIENIGGTNQTAKKAALKTLYRFAEKENLSPAILNEKYLVIGDETYQIGIKNGKLVVK